MSGSEPLPHEEAVSHLHFHPIGHRGSQPAYEVPKASNNVECGSSRTWLAADVNHNQPRPPFHECQLQLEAMQNQVEIQCRLCDLESDVQRIKNKLGM